MYVEKVPRMPTLPSRHAIVVGAENYLVYLRAGFVLYRHTDLASEVFSFFHKVSDDTLLLSRIKVPQALRF